LVRAAGFEGSERSLRRAVASAKEAWRQKQALEGRVYRPWVSEPGEWLQFVVGRGSEGEGEQTGGRRQSCPSYRVPEGASPYWRSGFGEPIELVARESPRHQLLHVHRGSRCIRCLALASEHARAAGSWPPPRPRSSGAADAQVRILLGALASTGQDRAPNDRLTALAIVLLHLFERPRHRRRFDAAARVLVRLVEESHQD
jgi:hypothetical protein